MTNTTTTTNTTTNLRRLLDGPKINIRHWPSQSSFDARAHDSTQIIASEYPIAVISTFIPELATKLVPANKKYVFQTEVSLVGGHAEATKRILQGLRRYCQDGEVVDEKDLGNMPLLSLARLYDAANGLGIKIMVDIVGKRIDQAEANKDINPATVNAIITQIQPDQKAYAAAVNIVAAKTIRKQITETDAGLVALRKKPADFDRLLTAAVLAAKVADVRNQVAIDQAKTDKEDRKKAEQQERQAKRQADWEAGAAKRAEDNEKHRVARQERNERERLAAEAQRAEEKVAFWKRNAEAHQRAIVANPISTKLKGRAAGDSKNDKSKGNGKIEVEEKAEAKPVALTIVRGDGTSKKVDGADKA